MIKSNQALVVKSSNNLWVYYIDNKGSACHVFLVDRIVRNHGHAIPTSSDYRVGKLFGKDEVSTKLNITL